MFPNIINYSLVADVQRCQEVAHITSSVINGADVCFGGQRWPSSDHVQQAVLNPWLDSGWTHVNKNC